MKKIFEEYGEVLIALLIAGGIFLFFSGAGSGGEGGIRRITGGWIEEQTKTSLAHDASASFDIYAGTGKLYIEYVNDPIIAGIKTPVADHFRATLENGGQAEVSVCRIYDSKKEEYYTQIEEGKEYMYLEKAGIYTVCIMARDSCGRQQLAMLHIPVQRQ